MTDAVDKCSSLESFFRCNLIFTGEERKAKVSRGNLMFADKARKVPLSA